MIEVSSRARSLSIRITIAVAAIGAIGYGLYRRNAGSAASPTAGGNAAPAGGDRVVPVQTAPVKAQDLPIWIDGLGSVTAVQQVTVHTLVDGRLDKVLFTEGQPVKKGDVLAQVDPRPYMVQLHQAEGALARDTATRDTAKRTYEREKSLHEQNLIAQAQVDADLGALGQAEGAVKVDESQIESAKLQLDYAAIKAPIDGITGVRLIDAGNLVHAADASGIVVITAIDPAAVIFTIPQDKLTDINSALLRGDVAVHVFNRDGTKELGQGTVAVLDNQINAATATLRLKALIKNPDRALWPNAFVRARMLVETRVGALSVPALAVQQGPTGPYVYVVGADQTAQLRPVTVDLTTDDTAVISKGVKVGDVVVTEGQSQLRPGGKVSLPKPAGEASSGTPASAPGSGKRGSGAPRGK